MYDKFTPGSAKVYPFKISMEINLPKSGTRGPTLWILFDVIRNLLESWLDSKIPDVIPEIPVYQIRRNISRT